MKPIHSLGRAAAAVATVLAAPVAPALAQSSLPEVTPVVTTEHGDVQGFQDDGINAYLGLRYGKAPIGELRFMPPEEPEDWDGIYDATTLGAPAMQMYTPSGPRTTDFTRQIQSIFPTGGESKIDNEDALFLNVWTPDTPTEDDEDTSGKRPVMVWFHGGGYAYGSGGWPAYDGRNLAEKGNVVVVTVNHRLNAFGYMYLGDRFGEKYAKSGNLGNLDLVASLEWVRDNIEAFGGDPDNVTIMGESGGGSKVSHLLAMPAADGLFHKAIIQSGPGVTSGKRQDAIETADMILDEADINTEEELRAIPAERLLAAARKVDAELSTGSFGGGAQLGPIVDEVVLPRDPFMPTAPEQSKDIPVMIGWNKDEMTLFTASQPWFGQLSQDNLERLAPSFGENGAALVEHYTEEMEGDTPTYIAVRAMGARFMQGSFVLADQKARQNGAPVYMYWLTYETDTNNGILRAPHTLDIPFMFDNAEESRILVGSGDGPIKLADMMSDAWISFARTGTPSSDQLPEWVAYTAEDRKVMKLDTDPAMVTEPERGARRILSGG